MLDPVLFGATLLLAEALIVAASAVPARTPPVAAAAALGYVVVGLLRRDYALPTLLRSAPHQAGRVALAWSVAVVSALVVGRLSRLPVLVPGGGSALIAAGLGAVALLRLVAARGAKGMARSGRIALRRLMLVGEADAVAAFVEAHEPAGSTYRLVAGVTLRDQATEIDDDLTLAVATARLRRPDDLLLLLPESDGVLLRALDAFRSVPADIHLGTPFPGSDRLGQALPAIRLAGPPMTAWDRLAKRAVDVVVAAAAIVALSPLMLAVALAIKLDSPGPVFFRQRRVGYNQQPFRIVKFRSMSTMEDGRQVRQARAGDSRITRVGRWLRRTNVDELPQLINVLAGDMSLVGPRPHALTHDQAFAEAHAPYARRHVVRPGITGWAQVNGFRGETDTPEKIEGRVRHDLDYLDNWSLWLDFSILVRTALSPRAFRNAG